MKEGDHNMRSKGSYLVSDVTSIYGINDASSSSYKKYFVTQAVEEGVKDLCSDIA